MLAIAAACVFATASASAQTSPTTTTVPNGQAAQAREKLRVELQQKRDEAKNKLQIVRDETKRRILQQTATQMDSLNDRKTEHFANAIMQIEGVLGRIEVKIATAKTEGKDVTTAETSVAVAKTKIAEAKTAITAQAAKVYEIKITDQAETALREQFQFTKNLFGDDIKDIHDKVKVAHDAVRQAIISLNGNETR